MEKENKEIKEETKKTGKIVLDIDELEEVSGGLANMQRNAQNARAADIVKSIIR